MNDIHKVMTMINSCCVCLGFAGTDGIVTFRVLLLNFLCNLVDILFGPKCIKVSIRDFESFFSG